MMNRKHERENHNRMRGRVQQWDDSVGNDDNQGSNEET
jgi:hypothetical protein